MIELSDRKIIIKDIYIAVTNGARLEKACRIIDLSIRTVQRWRKNEVGDRRKTAKKFSPKTLTESEKNQILDICNSNEYCELTPNEIVPILAEKGQYIASESMFYRVLKENKLLKHRENTKLRIKKSGPIELIADGPNQVLSWDITYLRTSIKGIFYYLYIFMDVWSRKIVGWTVEERESGEIASNLIESICIENGLESIYLHSDNGKPMRCGTMLATLDWLGVNPSFSRPYVKNDNPYSESLFKTVKYRPEYPDCFSTIDHAKKWVNNFINWYNTEHRHSGIKYVTPEQRHLGFDREILRKRHETYQKAKMRVPQRWAKETRNWSFIEKVFLNKKPEKIYTKKIA